MSSMLKTGMEYLATASASAMGEAVTYRRDGEETPLTAIPARTPVENDDFQGVKVTSYVHDFIVAIADFPYDTPEHGDEIDFDGKTYEVQRVGGKAWSYSDAFRIRYRIHTRELGDAGE